MDYCTRVLTKHEDWPEFEELAQLIQEGHPYCRLTIESGDEEGWESLLLAGEDEAEIAVIERLPVLSGSVGEDEMADLLEDARALEYHLRLQTEQRLLLDQIGGLTLAQRVFGYASRGGSESLAANAGTLARGEWADFFTVDMRALEIAGVAPEHLLAAIVFTQQRAGICDVAVKGEFLVRDGEHPAQDEIVTKYEQLSSRVWKS